MSLSLGSILAVGVSVSGIFPWINHCSWCLNLRDLLLVCSVLFLSVPQGAAEVSGGGCSGGMEWDLCITGSNQ